MKNHIYSSLLWIACMTSCSLQAVCQYYYKDIVSTNQINRTFHLYSVNQVKAVKLTTFNGNVPVTEGFTGEQKISYRPGKVVTYTKAPDIGESYLIALYNKEGQLIKSTDSSVQVVSTTWYQYAGNRLIQLSNETIATDKSSAVTETHNWLYEENGRPVQMIKIKNGSDTTLMKFSPDEKGNIETEEAFRHGISQGKIYYYYDNKNQLTDVVRFNERARRLVPDYIFEYEDNGDLSSLTIIPEAGGSLQKWYYRYDDNGLKLADFCYNKTEILQGKVEYEYSY